MVYDISIYLYIDRDVCEQVMYFYMKRICIHNRGNLYKRLIVEPFYIIEKYIYILKGIYI